MKLTKRLLAIVLVVMMIVPSMAFMNTAAGAWTITFDPDGGEMVGPTTYQINTGDFYVDVLGEMPQATLEGYTLTGWYNEKYNYVLDMSDTSYFAVAEDITFVAMWEEAPVVDPEPTPDPEPVVKDWTMYFDPDGGVMAEGWATEYGVNTGDTYADIFGETVPQATLEGYTLVGWYAEKWNFTLTDGDVTSGGYYAVSEDCYFVALWEEAPVTPEPTPDDTTPDDKPADKSWTMTLDPDGGVMDEGFATAYYFNTGDAYVDIMPAYPTATLEGYVIAGWYLEAYNYTFTQGDYETGYYALSEDCTLVALWEEAPVVDPEPTPDPSAKDWTMYFDPDGGVMAEGWATEYGVNTGDLYSDIFGATVPQATLEGYTLVGWYAEAYNFTLTDGDVTGGGYYAVSEDCYFVALWEEAPVVDPEPTPDPDPTPIPDPDKPADKSWTMTLDPDGGVLDAGVEYHYYFNTGDFYADVMPAYPTATLEGYNLTGWYLEAWNYTFTQGDYETGYYALAEDAYLVALWEEAPVVDPEPTPDPSGKDWTMYFDPDGGVMAEGWATEYGVNTGDLYSDIFGATVPQATLEGYTLVGWYAEAYNFTLTDGDVTGGGYFAVAEDVYFVALWEEAPVVDPEPTKAWTMTFDPDGGVMDEGFETVYAIDTGDAYADILPAYPTATLEGYVLAGWYLEAYNFTFTQGDYETGYYAISEDCVLVALWEEDPNYVPPTECTHVWGEWVVTVEPQVGVEGEQTRTCTLCGDVETEVIPALEAPVEPECTCDVEVSVDGTKITIEGLIGDTFVDAWIAAGEKTSYAEVKADYIFRAKAGSTRIDAEGVLTYDVGNAGTYTVLVRFSDCEIAYIEVVLTSVDVVVTKNVITVDAVDPDLVKDIFIASGDVEAYKDVKANMVYHLYSTSAKIVDGKWTYRPQVDGTYTVYIRHHDGTVVREVVNCDLGLKVATTIVGNTVSFSGLTDFYVLRYAKGEYETSGQIKRAPDCVNIKPAQVVDGTWSAELESGTYTFVLQTLENDYAYYTVTVG